MRRLYILPILLLAACSHKEWHKPGETPQAFGQDKLYCTHYAAKAAPTMFGTDFTIMGTPSNPSTIVRSRDINEDARRDLFDGCMMSRGWQLIEVTN